MPMGVLDGIKILELARVPPAELPGMLLADVGADVLKIETPEPDRPEGGGWVRRTIHTFTNSNKRSMTLNMKSPEGQALFRKLAATADVIVEGFRPGVMKRLGADYEAIAKLNPRVVYCSLSGFGPDGPYAPYPPARGRARADRRGRPQAGDPAQPGRRLRGRLDARRARHRARAVRTGAHRPGPARGRRLPRHERVAPGRDAEHALLLQRRSGAPARRGLPRRLLSLLRDLRDARRQAPHDRLHRAVALEQLLQGDRPARPRALRPHGRPVRARGQRRGGRRAARNRGDHQDPRPRRVVRASRPGRRVRRQGLRRRGDGAGPAAQPPPDDRGRPAPDARTRAAGGGREQAVRHAGHDPERRADAQRAHRGGARRARPARGRDREAPREGHHRVTPRVSAAWRQLVLLSLAELGALGLWFSANAVLPALSRDWQLGDGGRAGLTLAVQLGFIVGTLGGALANLPDVVPPRRVMVWSMLLGAGANAVVALWVDALGPALALRFVTGVAMAGAYPPAMKLIATWFLEGPGLAIRILIGALTVGSASP